MGLIVERQTFSSVPVQNTEKIKTEKSLNLSQYYIPDYTGTSVNSVSEVNLHQTPIQINLTEKKKKSVKSRERDCESKQ